MDLLVPSEIRIDGHINPEQGPCDGLYLGLQSKEGYVTDEINGRGPRTVVSENYEPGGEPVFRHSGDQAIRQSREDSTNNL
jgi:hypothetical protein